MDAARALRVLQSNRHCVLATASLDGEPWVSPLFFNCDLRPRLVWESERTARHSRLIRENPRCAIVVADLDNSDEAVYLECRAREAPPEDLAAALAVFQRGLHDKPEAMRRTTADYVHDRPLRLYEADVLRAYCLTQERSAEGYTLDRRTPIELPHPA